MKLEHLIYGTFPELPGSQQVVYKSSGIDDELQSWLIQQYDNYGDCKTEDFRSSLTFQWYREGLGVLTKFTHHGKDFSGRWGALLRHSAIISEEQFIALCGCLDSISSQLVESGTPDQLSQSGEFEIADEIDKNELIERLLQINPANYEANLKKLLTGQRLVLYSDLNTENTNAYLQNLLLLTPLRFRCVMNWSELVFRELDELDLSLVFSSRYSAPDAEILEFQSIGDSSLSEIALPDEEADAYIISLSDALTSSDPDALGHLLLDS